MNFRNSNRYLSSKNDAFTLVELAITMTIVAILATVATSSYGEYRRGVVYAEVRAMMYAAANSLEQYYVICEQYPNNFSNSANDCNARTIRNPNPNAQALASEVLSPSGLHIMVIQPPSPANPHAYTLVTTPTPSSSNNPCTEWRLSQDGMEDGTGTECW